MDETVITEEMTAPKRKFDLSTLVVIFAFVGVLFSLGAITFKRFPDAGISKAFANIGLTANTMFFIGLAFAVPAVIYIVYYIIRVLLNKEPTAEDKVALINAEYDNPIKLEAGITEREIKETKKQTERHAAIDSETEAKVAKEAMNARIREIKKELDSEERAENSAGGGRKKKQSDDYDFADDIYADEDEYAREVPLDALFYAVDATPPHEPQKPAPVYPAYAAHTPTEPTPQTAIKPADDRATSAVIPIPTDHAHTPAAAPRIPTATADITTHTAIVATAATATQVAAEPITNRRNENPPEAADRAPAAHTPQITPLPPQKDTKAAAAAAAARKQKIEDKKMLFAPSNIAQYLRNYFIETASCFLMDRDKYIDYFGIAPYNKITIKPSKTAGVPDEVVYSITATKPRLYKFCTYLIDMERFITHEQLYHNFILSIESGKSLVRISEQLHKLYRKLYKNDFVNNFTNKEDFDNLIVLVANNYILGNNNFRSIFTRIPFEIPDEFIEDNIINYLSNPTVIEKFTEAFPNYTDIGFDSLWDALYICFVNSVKHKLSYDQIESAITTDHKRISKALARMDKKLSKRKIA